MFSKELTTAVCIKWPKSCINASLTLYQPMMAFAVMVSNKPIRIFMGALILGVILQYMVSASLSCFLWLVKG